MQFVYTAKNVEGKTLKGFFEAKDKTVALESLKKNSLFVVSIAPAKENKLDFKFGQKKISTKDKIIFTKQLGIMIRSGLSIVEALKSLNEESNNKTLSKVINELIADVEGGSSLSAALSKHSAVFGEIYVNMIKSGEKSGNVELILERLTMQLEKDYELNRKVRGALSYPIFVLVTMTVVVALVIVFIIPQLKLIFDDAGAELPALTRAMIAISNFLRKYGLILIGLLVGLVFALGAWQKTAKGRFTIDRVIIKIPLISLLLTKTYMARFSRTFASLLSSGLPLLEVFKSSGKVIGNIVYETELDKMAKKVETGESLSSVFKKSSLFPNIVGQLVTVGEKSGKVNEVFDDIADFFDKDVDNMTTNLSTMLEPILMVFMGVGIGLVIVSVLQPIYGLVNVI